MVITQLQATEALQVWQQLRAAGLTPQERIERLMADFFDPPSVSDVEYDATLRNVAEEMSHA